MELRHLRYFVAAAEEQHFTRAARRLGIAQPPLTQQIRALEQEIGVPLFDRLGRGVVLTDAGRILLEEARDILDRVTYAVLRSRNGADGTLGRIGVGFTVSASFDEVVVRSLSTFRTRFPKVELLLEEARSTELIQAIRQGRIDVAFVRPPVMLRNDLVIKMVSSEPMVAAVPSGHRLARRAAVRLRDLSDEPFILYPRTTRLGLCDEIIGACERAGFSPVVVQRAPQLASTLNLVASGLGISIVPACMSRSRSDAVRYLSLRGERLNAALALVSMKDANAVASANFTAIVRTYMRRGQRDDTGHARGAG